MKKLMTMLAAAAMSFGLFADLTLPVGTSFEGNQGAIDTQIEASDIADLDGATWSTDDTGAKLTPITGIALPYDDAEKIGSRLAKFGSANTTTLSVKTAFDKPLYRTQEIPMGEGVYFDSIIKFTFCDETPAAVDAGVKLMLWAQDLSDAETPAAETNLYVRALCGNAAKDYMIGSIDDAAHRITIKIIPDIVKATGDDVPGFVVFKDGVACICQDEYGIGYTAAQLNTKAAKFFNDRTLFVSLDQSSDDWTKLTAVGFAGQGVIDDVAITDVAPVADAADPIVQAITLSKGVASVTCNGTLYETDFEAILDENGQVGMTVVYKTGWTAPAGFDPTAAVLPYGTGDDKWTVPSIAAKVKIGDKSYATLAEAIADIPNIGTGPVTLALQAPLTLDAAVTFNAMTADAEPAAIPAVLDLNGQALTFEGEGYAITAVTPLTITDSSMAGTGSITATDIVTSSGSLSIDAGTFNGAVAITAGAGDITGGTFEGTFSSEVLQIVSGGKFKADPKVYVKTGLDTELKEGYYEIVSATYSITYLDGDTELPITVTGAPESYKYNQDELVIPDAEKEGCNFVQWEGDTPGVKFEYEKGMTGDLELYAIFEAKTFAVTLNNGQNSTIATSYTDPLKTVPYDTKMTITATAATGFEFAETEYTGWTKVNSTTLTQDIVVQAAVTITAPDATAAGKTITVTFSKATGVDSVTVTPNGGAATTITSGTPVLCKKSDLPLTVTLTSSLASPIFKIAVNGDEAVNVDNPFTYSTWDQIVDGAQVVFTAEAGVKPHIVPGEVITDMTAEEAEAAKADLLVAPGLELTGDDLKAYQGYFKAVGVKGNVTFELDPTATDTDGKTLAEQATAEAAKALTSDSITFTGVKGLFYGLSQDDTLEGMTVTDSAQANGETITFTPDKTGDAGFWKIIVQATAFDN